jgi:membrane protease YdiL (CAAX protease family)
LIIFSYFNIQNLGFEEQTSLFDIFGKNPFGIFVSAVVAILLAPIVEELFFRGFVLRTLYKHIGATWAIIITTLIFASLHFEFQAIVPLLILSLVLSVLFIRTKSIWPGIIFHILNNTIAFTVIYFFEDIPL